MLCREEWENRQNWYGVPIRVRLPASNKKGDGQTEIPQRPVLFVANTCEVVCALGAPFPVSTKHVEQLPIQA